MMLIVVHCRCAPWYTNSVQNITKDAQAILFCAAFTHDQDTKDAFGTIFLVIYA